MNLHGILSAGASGLFETHVAAVSRRRVPVRSRAGRSADRRRATSSCIMSYGFEMVPEAGIEPARLSARDFLATSTFAAALLDAGRSWPGARLHHSHAAVGARRLLSTPSQTAAWAWLGVGSGTEASRAFADFDGLHFGRFPPKAQVVQVPCVYRFHHSGCGSIMRTRCGSIWRREPESNRPLRICNPVHNRFAIAPCCRPEAGRQKREAWASLSVPSGAGDESRTRDLNLGKVALYQLSYSRVALKPARGCSSPERSRHYRHKRDALNAEVRRSRSHRVPRQRLSAPVCRPRRPQAAWACARARLRAPDRSSAPARSRDGSSRSRGSPAGP